MDPPRNQCVTIRFVENGEVDQHFYSAWTTSILKNTMRFSYYKLFISGCVCACALANNGVMANFVRVNIFMRAVDEKHKFNE